MTSSHTPMNHVVATPEQDILMSKTEENFLKDTSVLTSVVFAIKSLFFTLK